MSALGKALGLPALVLALSLAACGGQPTAVPSASNFAAPDVADKAATEQAASCATISDRTQRVLCLVKPAEDLLAQAYAPVVTSRGLEFTRPTVVVAERGAQTACGLLTRVAYCADDATIVLPTEKIATLGDRATTEVEWGAETKKYFEDLLTPDQMLSGGSYGAIMALAHEYGHHVQSLVGYEQINAEQMSSDPANAAAYSSEFELMADCFAGWTAAVLDQERVYRVQPIDQWAAINALSEVGDDFIQENRGGSAAVKPIETFNHGAANERANAWVDGAGIGFDGGEPYEGCLALAKKTVAARASASPNP